MRTIVYSVVAASLVSVMGCGSEGPEGPGPIEEPEQSEAALAVFDKVDLLFVVDNSISMAEEQQVLASSVEKLLRGMINPPCVDSGGGVVEEPASPEETCPTGSFRRAAPVRDLHIGVISSNMGDLGGGSCEFVGTPADKSHLRTLGSDGPVATYQDLGFLAWDPDGELSPAGESDFEALVASAVDIVSGMGEQGCGYEMPLEAMNRFLVDPAPYDALVRDNDGQHGSGIDEALLAERAAFLRPDSIVGVVLLSDENDCSLDPTAGDVVLRSEPFYRATSVCDTDPNDACCTSCALPTPDGCSADPSCVEPVLTTVEDHANIRCFDQKRRYGVDFHYPTVRYVNALSSEEIDPATLDYAAGDNAIPNPLFYGDRQPEHVIFTAITGVPWQDLVVDPNDPESAPKTSQQMETDGSWAWLVGDNGGAPLDPFMIESVDKRVGVSPATGEATVNASAPNGGDRSIPDADDLQYACIFALAEPIESACSCYAADGCTDDPACIDGAMVAAAARPGTRQLEVARGLGSNAVVGSICPPIVALPETSEGESRSPQANSNYDAALSQMNERVSELLPEAEE